MSKIANIAPQHRAVMAPSALRTLPGWLMWRYEAGGGPKPIKVPYYADGGRRSGQQGSPADRAKLTSFAAATAAAAKRGMDGVGLALLPDWDITALDFDHCVGPDGSLPPEVEDIVNFTYAEYSPSGAGVRAFVRGNLGNHKSHKRGDGYGFETFATNGYVTFTGNILPSVEILGYEDTISDVTPEVIALCNARFGASTGTVAKSDDPFDNFQPKLNLSFEDMEQMLAALDPDMDRDDWVRVGMALHHECEGDDTGFELWDDWSSGGSKYPGTEALRHQWHSFERPREGARTVTMASVVRMAKMAGADISRPFDAATVDELKAVVAANEPYNGGTVAHTPASYTGKFPVFSAGELTRRAPTDWLIKGVIPKADLVVMYGASGSGKTFVGLDMMAAIARGVAWRGMRVRKCRVMVIAAEGSGNVGKRIEAYCRQHEINADDLDIGVMTAAPNFLLKPDISEVVASITAAGGFDVVLVDTFAQVTPGANENAGEHMGLALAHARAICEATGATVVLVHHAGKDASKGARGWSGIRAAADAELEIVRHENGQREIRVTKMKDGQDDLSWGFTLASVVVGIDGDGDEITSCVVMEAEIKVAPPENIERKGVKKVGRVEQHVLDMIDTRVDPAAESMDLRAFIRLCAEGIPPPPPNKRDTRHQVVERAVKTLAKGQDAPLIIENHKVIFCTT